MSENTSSSVNSHSEPVLADTRASWRRDLLLLGLFFGALYFFMLGSHPLANPDEGRYAEIPREMIVTGDWVLPRLNDVYYFEKPPLVYWAAALAQMIGGQNEWALRSVPALLGLFGVVMTYAFARRFRGRVAGLASAIVLGTSLMYFALARILILDMAVSVFIAASLFCFILGVREEPGRARRLLFYGLYVAAALATLTKGLIGFLLPGAVMFLWLLIFNQWKRLRPLYLPSGGLLFLAVAAPWHILAAQQNDQWAWFYFVREHWLRFTTTTHNRYEPWWYFGPVLLLGLFPWTGHFWNAAKEALPGAWARRKEYADAWFLVLWSAFIVLFFSRSQSKLPPYVLPVFPALAVLLGSWIARIHEEKRIQAFRLGTLISIVFSCVLALACLALYLSPGLIRDREAAVAAGPWLLVAGLFLLAGCLVAWRRLRSGLVWRSFLLQAVMAAVFFLCIAGAYPRFETRSSVELARRVASLSGPGDLVFHYRCFAHDFVYYGRAPVGTVDHEDELELSIDPQARASGRFVDETGFMKHWNSSTRIWVLVRNSELAKLVSDPAFRYHLIGSNHRYTLLSNQP
jgi:4-amino-4-deoxy-L-arabinose transferase-like glycosyltransferase